ncbi:cyclic AMP-dependent transcription factor ATF-3 [Oenanthe melanoleuca]|nr:cyclic AMP-dependent transcription factor ATF-3 [Oenanthe melanoleuca]
MQPGRAAEARSRGSCGSRSCSPSGAARTAGLRSPRAPAGTAAAPSKMMVQHSGQVSALEVSASAIVPTLSPAGSLGFDDFTNLTPLVKEELRFAIQNKRQFHRMSSTLDTVTVSERPVETAVLKTEFSPEEDERKKRRRERNKIAAAKCRNKKKEKTECLQKESEKLETINAELKAQIEELKNEKQHLIYMLNLHRPTCIVRAQNGRTPEDERNLFIQQIKEGTLQG